MSEQNTTPLSITALLTRFEHAVHAAAKDDYQDGGSYFAMEKRAAAVRETKTALLAAYDSLQQENWKLRQHVRDLDHDLNPVDEPDDLTARESLGGNYCHEEVF